MKGTATVALLLALAVPSGAPSAEASALVFQGIRPGSWMYAPSLCTMNFLFNATGSFEDGGPFYLGTAKHCVGAGDPRGRVVTLAVALGASTPVMLQIGAVSHATKGATDPERDYALVQIKPELEQYLSPSMAIVGGPTSVWDGTASGPVAMVGHGAGIGTGGTARLGTLACVCPDDEYGFGITTAILAGDSGSPVRTLSGAAIGSLSTDALNHYAYSRGTLPPNGATVLGTSVHRVLHEWGMRVVTCASLTPWPGFGCPPE